MYDHKSDHNKEKQNDSIKSFCCQIIKDFTVIYFMFRVVFSLGFNNIYIYIYDVLALFLSVHCVLRRFFSLNCGNVISFSSKIQNKQAAKGR